MQHNAFHILSTLGAILIWSSAAGRVTFRSALRSKADLHQHETMLRVVRKEASGVPCECCESCPNKCSTAVNCATAGSPEPSTPAASDPCMPQCTWKCDSPTCDQDCTPDCQQPRCQTRCPQFDTSGCQMKCNQPRCMVVCPERFCAGKDCPACTTKCSQPQCKLECNDPQPCRNVCAQPVCTWNCKKPADCPVPKCHMICEEPKACAKTQFATDLPALKSDEHVVSSFAASARGPQTSTLSHSSDSSFDHQSAQEEVQEVIVTTGKAIVPHTYR
eukprot:gnl/TRDRNA2_/TRDRNA2_136108_c0_seq1.p1 gnl/TRDRNA2_/TRDRNA2_136108_c0~~gnl/TRDRNA2_/TRDRNA2_136108_c0_seq1.p1  ORF type:complete len:275 (-),score=20.31 gnl/TRDRNA2_/TRDRNA2_136108_c0_seq1:37-861(-)